MSGIWLVAFILQWILLLLFATLVIRVQRQISTMQAAGPLNKIKLASIFEVGEHITGFTLNDSAGHSCNSTDFLHQHKSLIFLFVSVSCGPCKDLIRDIGMFIEQLFKLTVSEWSVILIVRDDPAIIKNTIVMELTGLNIPILVDLEGVVSKQYGIPGVPFALAVNKEGYVLQQQLGPSIDWCYQITGVRKPAILSAT